MTYEQSVKLVECLQRIEDTINLRPHNWLLHCASVSRADEKQIDKEEKDKEMVPYLLHIVFYLREEAALLVLKLLVALFEDENSVCTTPPPHSFLIIIDSLFFFYFPSRSLKNHLQRKKSLGQVLQKRF